MTGYPQMIVPVNHIEPSPRRVRAVLDGNVVLDTMRALYVWEWSGYPTYYLPLADIDPGCLVDDGRTERRPQGTARLHTIRGAERTSPGAAQVYTDDALEGLADTAHLEWEALDAWYEEDEQVFVHPRNPYARVDALRSSRRVRVELEGVVLADSSAPVMVFETGLPTRYYLNRTDVNFEHLVPSDTVTSCPYKGTTTDYWSVRVGDVVHPDLAWAYNFPTAELRPIAGLVAFYNEKVDVLIDGEPVPRPKSPFSD